MTTDEAKPFDVHRAAEDGIERVTYTPKERRFESPILLQHGMWHGAWCWRLWQERLASWGWETHAYSLPGHAGSPVQRPIRWCTLSYYLGFLEAEIERLPRKPVVFGHSMGGALIQWHLRRRSHELPATVMVASWASHSSYAEGLVRFLRMDPIGVLLTTLSGMATAYVRTPRRAADLLLSPRAVVTAEELHAQLGPESALVMAQHNPPFWFPAKQIDTPMLWLAGEVDATLSVEASQRSAAHYEADFVVAPQAGHNLMMEHNHQETVETIHHWLSNCDVP
jgi:pimeloyl-ACP methyl ester carboxylesterase